MTTLTVPPIPPAPDGARTLVLELTPSYRMLWSFWQGVTEERLARVTSSAEQALSQWIAHVDQVEWVWQ